jgi:hypothetical protein
MTTGAAQFFTPAQLFDVGGMVEDNIFFKLYLALQQPFLMAAAAHAAFIRDFRPGFALFVHTGKIIHHHRYSRKFPFDFVSYPGWEMAIGTGDMVVGRIQPTGVIGSHDMTGIAKFGLGGEFHSHYHEYGKYHQGYGHGDAEPLPTPAPNQAMQGDKIAFE